MYEAANIKKEDTNILEKENNPLYTFSDTKRQKLKCASVFAGVGRRQYSMNAQKKRDSGQSAENAGRNAIPDKMQKTLEERHGRKRENKD